jgi:hypothetical protein
MGSLRLCQFALLLCKLFRIHILYTFDTADLDIGDIFVNDQVVKVSGLTAESNLRIDLKT